MIGARLLLAIMVLLSCAAPAVSAHTLEENGGIGAVLHLTPADDPVAGQESRIRFLLEDRSGQFKTSECNCRLEIMKDGQLVTSRPLTDNELRFTFPARGLYTLYYVGTPKRAGAFTAFSLQYNVRVNRETRLNPNRQADVVLRAAFTAAAGIAIFSVIIFAVLYRRPSDRSASRGG